MKRVLSNSVWLTAAHLSGFVIPLLELPILTRALGPEVYGAVLFALSLSLAFSLVVEYGFNLSASREVAVSVGDPERIAQIVGNVFLAKLIIALLVVSLSFLAMLVLGLPAALSIDLILPAGLFFLAFGFSPFWYFQGTEQMVGPVLLNLALRVVALVGLWIFVSEPTDGALALYILAVAGLVNTGLTSAWVFRKIGKPTCSMQSAFVQIKDGWHTFMYRSANDVLMSASPAVLGLASSKYETGIFVPAEKLVKAAAGMAMPILTAFFPFFSKQYADGGAARGWLLVFVMTALAAVGAGLLVWLSPWLISVLAGDEFVKSVELITWFAALIPLRVFNQSLGLSVLIPQGRDRSAGYSLMFSALIAMCMGYMLATVFGAIGMVWGLLIGETLLLVLLIFAAIKLNLGYR